MSIKNKLGIGEIHVTGLDIGSSAVKMVQLRKDESGYVTVAAACENIQQNLEDSPDTVDNTVNAIKECFKKTQAGKNIVSGLCGSDVVVRSFELPNLPPEAIDQAVRFEAYQISPLDMKDSVVAYQILSSPKTHPRETKIKGVLVVATNKSVSEKEESIKRSSLKNIMMDVDGLALLNCLKVYEQVHSENSYAVINIGAKYTNIAILGADGLPFVRDLQYGTDDLFKRLSRLNQMEHEEVVDAFENKNSKRIGKLIESLKQSGCVLISDVSETIRFYNLQEGAKPVNHIYVSGGMACVNEFIKLISDKLNHPVEVMNPFTEIPCQAGAPGCEMLQDNGPKMAVATGLALREI